MYRSALFVVTCWSTPLLLSAQTTTPAGCTGSVNQWFNTAYRAARDSAAMPGGKPADVRGLLAQRTAKTAACAERFHVDQMSGPELLELAALYSATGSDSLAMVAVNKRLAEPGLTDADKANALVSMIRALTKPDTLLILRAEPYMAQLDAMPDDVMLAKLQAHSALDGEYRYLDVDPRIRQHSLAIIALGRRLKASGDDARTPDAVTAFGLLEAYTDLAEVHADLGDLDSTFMVLDQARTDHPEISARDFDQLITPERARYALVGKPAKAIEAGHWLNAPADTRSINPAGKVTVIEFTAHWCIPCRNSYPDMTSMAADFGKEGARFIFATEFYGYLGTRQNLSPAAEFAADQDYYVGEHGVHFPVAIADAPPPYTPGTTYMPGINDAHYQVGGIPQTVIIDRTGVIRRILTGWDSGNGARMRVLLADLLKN